MGDTRDGLSGEFWDWRRDFLPIVAMGAIALLLGTVGMNRSGPQWPDSPRYANAGAMMHDWLRSGEFTHLAQFARENYSQYPAFSVPYHPPLFPSLLGLSFMPFGVSYELARVLVALTLGVGAIFYWMLLRSLGLGRWAAMIGCVLLLTTPEIVRWSRDTMSEVPGLMFLLGAAWCFARGLETDRPRYFWVAFGLAGAAFLCRVTTAGVLPGWFFFGMFRYRPRKVLAARVLVPAGLYLAAGIAWVLFAARFGRYEVRADGRASLLSDINLNYFRACLGGLSLWGSSLLGLTGAAWFLCRDRDDPAGLFWLTWLAGFSAFKLMTPTTPELRHFFMAMPAFAGLAAYLFGRCSVLRVYRPAAVLLLLAGVSLNADGIRQLPSGVVGYSGVGHYLAAQEEFGNVLLACPEDQELIFRFRANQPRIRRQMIRGDRVLAVRLPEYAAIAPQPLAHSTADVLNILRRGRVRYLVTSCPDRFPDERWTEEMALAHQVAATAPEQFILMAKFPLRIHYGGPIRRGSVFVWRFAELLPEGQSQLPVVIPTAQMTLRPKSE